MPGWSPGLFADRKKKIEFNDATAKLQTFDTFILWMMDSAVISQTFSICCNISTPQNAPVLILRVPKSMISV